MCEQVVIVTFHLCSIISTTIHRGGRRAIKDCTLRMCLLCCQWISPGGPHFSSSLSSSSFLCPSFVLLRRPPLTFPSVFHFILRITILFPSHTRQPRVSQCAAKLFMLLPAKEHEEKTNEEEKLLLFNEKKERKERSWNCSLRYFLILLRDSPR